jgi:hypothetical protein
MKFSKLRSWDRTCLLPQAQCMWNTCGIASASDSYSERLALSRRFNVTVRPTPFSLIQDQCPVPETWCLFCLKHETSDKVPTVRESNFTSLLGMLFSLYIDVRTYWLTDWLTDTVCLLPNFCPSFKFKKKHDFSEGGCASFFRQRNA